MLIECIKLQILELQENILYQTFRQNLRSATKVFAVNIGLFLVGFLLIEVIFGSWFKAPNLWSLSIYRNKDWTFVANEKYPGVNIVRYRRDYYGLRGDYGKIKQIRILTLGGSTTDERFVSDGKTWTDTLDNCLEKKIGSQIGTANAGVTGQTTRGHAKNFDVWLNHIPDLAPKYVLVYFGVNERGIVKLADKDDVRDFNESNRPISRIKILRKWFYMNSAIYAMWRIFRGNLAADKLGFAPYRRKDFDRRVFEIRNTQDKLGTERVNLRYVENSLSKIATGTPEFQKLLNAELSISKDKLNALTERLGILREKIIDFGATPVFVTQSWGHYRIKGGMISGDLDLYFTARAENESIMEFCAEKDMGCINLGEELEFHDNDFWDIVHTSPQGSSRIGNFICERLYSMKHFSIEP